MFDDYLTQNLISSLVIGGVLGLLIGLVFKRPKSWKVFSIFAVLVILSPWIGVDTRIFSADGGGTEFTLIHFSPFLMALTGMLCLCFLSRKALTKTPAKTRLATK